MIVAFVINCLLRRYWYDKVFLYINEASDDVFRKIAIKIKNGEVKSKSKLNYPEY